MATATSLRRSRHKQMTQRVIPITSASFIADRTLAQPLDWPAIFANDQPLALEIGCGTGHFVLARALAQPDMNFLAIDIYNKGCLKTCAKIDAAGVSNVRVMRVEARWLMEKGLQTESLAAVYINCPDPWPKKRHRRRRLVNREFLLAMGCYLVPGGDFFFSTDVHDYAENVAAALCGLTGYHNMLPAEWTQSLSGYPVSKYMQRFLDQGQSLYFMHHRRVATLVPDAKPAPAPQHGFRSDWQKVENG